MALDQSALLEVLEALKAAEVDARIRQAAETMIDAELASVIGAVPHERTSARTGHRNGYRPRVLASTAGDLELRIPKLRAGSFFPSLLERRRRVDQSLFAVIMEGPRQVRSCWSVVRAAASQPGLWRARLRRTRIFRSRHYGGVLCAGRLLLSSAGCPGKAMAWGLEGTRAAVWLMELSGRREWSRLV